MYAKHTITNVTTKQKKHKTSFWKMKRRRRRRRQKKNFLFSNLKFEWLTCFPSCKALVCVVVWITFKYPKENI